MPWSDVLVELDHVLLCSVLFMTTMLNVVTRLGLPGNSTLDNRFLSVDIASTLFFWDHLAQQEAPQTDDEPQNAQAKIGVELAPTDAAAPPLQQGQDSEPPPQAGEGEQLSRCSMCAAACLLSVLHCTAWRAN